MEQQLRTILREEINSFRLEIKEYCRALVACYISGRERITQAKMWSWIPIENNEQETSLKDVWERRRLVNVYASEVKISSRLFVSEYVQNSEEIIEALREIGFYTPEPHAVHEEYMYDLINGRKELMKKRNIKEVRMEGEEIDEIFKIVRRRMNGNSEVMRYIPDSFIIPDKRYTINIYHTICGLELPALSPQELAIYKLFQSGILHTTVEYSRSSLITSVYSLTRLSHSSYSSCNLTFLENLLSEYLKISCLISELSSISSKPLSHDQNIFLKSSPF
jgi:hypothetical protein